MIEKKCKECGEWFSNRKIAVHYWNIHKLKYKEVCEGEETREVPDPVKVETPKVEEKKNEKTTNQENKEVRPTPTTRTTAKERTKGFEDGEVINEYFKPFSKVEQINDEGEVFTEWC